MNKLFLARDLLQIQASIMRGRPFYSNLFVTRKCNCRCGFCNVWNNKQKDLSFEEIKRIIDEMADFGIKVVAITGGEPLLRQDIFEILHYLESKRMIYSLVSNGTLWNEEKANEIRKRKIFNLSFSLDTLKEKKYQKIRGINGLPLVKRTIALFKEKPLKHGFVNTLSVVTEQNIDEVFDIIEFDRQNNCKFSCGPVAVGQGFEFRAKGKEPKLSKQKVITTFSKLAEQCKTDKTLIGPSLYYKSVADYFAGKYVVPCDAGRFYISVDAAGGVSVCQDLPPFGNILKTGLEKTFERATPQQKIQACARNTPCFYGCSTFISMLIRPSLPKKIGWMLEQFKKGIL